MNPMNDVNDFVIVKGIDYYGNQGFPFEVMIKVKNNNNDFEKIKAAVFVALCFSNDFIPVDIDHAGHLLRGYKLKSTNKEYSDWIFGKEDEDILNSLDVDFSSGKVSISSFSNKVIVNEVLPVTKEGFC